MLDSACVSVNSGKIARGPRNIVIVAGSKATFTCVTDSADDDLCWGRSDKTQFLCNSVACNPGYSRNRSARNETITVDACNYTDSVRYDCHVCKEPKDKKIASIVVLGT